jgi:hypothetical protein
MKDVDSAIQVYNFCIKYFYEFSLEFYIDLQLS